MQKRAFEILRGPVTRVIAATLFGTVAMSAQLPAQEKEKEGDHHKHHHYKLVDVGTLGGPNSAFSIAGNFNAGSRGLNSRGTGAGYADTPTINVKRGN